MAAWSASGKTNYVYVCEGCHKMDVIHRELPPHELEWRQVNHFLMPEGGHAMSIDEVNELQMLWNKGCTSSQKFQVACERSQCLIATKACAHETFAMTTRKSVIPAFEKDLCTLVDLLEKGDLYPCRYSEKRKFEEEFWRDQVRPIKEKGGSTQAKMKEEVKASSRIQRVLDILSHSEDQPDFPNFEVEGSDDDDTDASGASSTMGSERDKEEHELFVDKFEDDANPEEDWETVIGPLRATFCICSR